jgi:pimeloyl-ACP methyl ester carboxylesterase
MKNHQLLIYTAALLQGALLSLYLTACSRSPNSMAVSPLMEQTDRESAEVELEAQKDLNLVAPLTRIQDYASLSGSDPNVDLRLIAPSATFRRIPDQVPTPDGDLYATGDHLVVTPVMDRERNQLLVFFPGTGGQPGQYSLFARHAAEQGFHVINLAYENAVSINFDICRGSLNPNCHKWSRLEVLTGINASRTLTTNRRPASAGFPRLSYLLRYLQQNFPQEGWDQYLDTSTNQLEWPRMIVAGHSQGGGMAAFTATLQKVNRVILFNATEPAQWTTEEPQTPASAYYGIAHEQETNVIPITRSWENLNLPGNLVNIEQAEPGYGGSHRLITNSLECWHPEAPNQGNPGFHNCVIADDYIPLDEAGQPLFTPLWNYLLGV